MSSKCRSLVQAARTPSLLFAALFLTLALVPDLAEAAPARPPLAANEAAAQITALRRAMQVQEERIAEQGRQLERQRQTLEQQRRQLDMLQQALGAGDREAPAPPAAAASPVAVGPPAAAPPSSRPLPAPAAAAEPAAEPAAVAASAAEANKPPPVDLLADVGGVLTRRGWLVLEPQLEYLYDTSNQFFFNGVEIVDAVLIGLIEANQTRNKTLTAALAARYGITNRMEADVRVPYVLRDNELTEQAVNTGAERSLNQDNAALGDVEFGLHYQLNRGQNGWPYFVGNLRTKTATGAGPYDVDPDDEAAVGSGFWAVEPSLTVIFPTDPAVLFGNVGYIHSFERTIDKDFADSLTGQVVRIKRVEPGDTVRASFGVGFALNEALSLSLGYAQDWVQSTKQTFVVDGSVQTAKTESFQVGQLAFGVSYALSDTVGINVNTSIGVTDEAPDARIAVRLPMSFPVVP